MNNFTKIAAAACLMLMGTSASAATVVNGSFEDIGTGSFNGSGWNHFSSIPGWTGNPNVEIQSDPTLSGINAQHGSNYAELDTNQDGGISQNIYFAAGDYELRATVASGARAAIERTMRDEPRLSVTLPHATESKMIDDALELIDGG